MDTAIRDAILSIMNKRTGIVFLTEIELLPDSAEEDILVTQELLNLAELFAITSDDAFTCALNQASPLAQRLWEEAIDSLA